LDNLLDRGCELSDLLLSDYSIKYHFAVVCAAKMLNQAWS
jgi:hypothetical protein